MEGLFTNADLVTDPLKHLTNCISVTYKFYWIWHHSNIGQTRLIACFSTAANSQTLL